MSTRGVDHWDQVVKITLVAAFVAEDEPGFETVKRVAFKPRPVGPHTQSAVRDALGTRAFHAYDGHTAEVLARTTFALVVREGIVVEERWVALGGQQYEKHGVIRASRPQSQRLLHSGMSSRWWSAR